MRVLVAGATGAMGRQLVPRLVEAGHEVHGMTRSETKEALLRGLGAVPVVADALDPEQVARAVALSQPEVVVHQLTAIGPMDMRHFDRAFAATNRLRTEGTDHLLSAARAAGVGRVVAQSFFAGYDRVGGAVKSEDDPFGTEPPAGMAQTVAAIRHVEDSVLAASWTQGLVLRYGGFYGPHTSLGPDGEQTEAVRRRRFPVVGDGGGVWSFVHIADAAEATVAAVAGGDPGVYNIVDDEPASVATWLPALAESLGARPPMRLPRLVGRLLAGETGTVMLTELRGASNAKAKQELCWSPRHASWREGFRQLGAEERAESDSPA